MQVRIAIVQGSPVVLLVAEDVAKVQQSLLCQSNLDACCLVNYPVSHVECLCSQMMLPIRSDIVHHVHVTVATDN